MAEGNHEDRLRELRERLYSRGAPPPSQPRHELTDESHPVPHTWQRNEVTPPPQTRAVAPETPLVPSDPIPMRRPKTSYRIKIITLGLLFFVVALALSGSFLLFGKNMISGDNISIEVKEREGRFAVAGGGELNLQITIGNQNTVPIESATLILEYPGGTQSLTEQGKELFRERKELNRIQAGEVVNIPVGARVFGEENEEKIVRASVEYRVQGSNATFFKEAEEFRFKISSSPVVLFVENVSKSASGQEVELKLSVSSNSPSPVSDILVKAEYPAGFEYIDSTPAPVSGRDTWSVSSVAPAEKKSITLKGVLTGKQDEKKIFKFTVGVANERDKLTLASVFTTQTEEILIEQPFLDLAVAINGKSDNELVLVPGTAAEGTITLTNSLSVAIRDAKIQLHIEGESFDESHVAGGFYDSTTDTITWDASSFDVLQVLEPGRSATVVFGITPKDNASTARTPQISLSISAEAKRLSEDSVSQRLTGTLQKNIKVESVVQLLSSVFYSAGAFPNTGPVPMRAEEATTYSVMMYVKNGTNAMADGVVTAMLPPYVTWLDKTTTPTVFTYNPQTREVSWKVGDLEAGKEREVEFQISVRPSLTQVGDLLTLVNTQRLKATDRFTGTTLRSESLPLTSHLVADPEHENEDGLVLPKSE